MSASRVPARLVSAMKLLVLVGFLLTTLLPMLWVVTTAFRPDAEVLTFPPRLFDITFTLRHFEDVVMDRSVIQYVTTSLLVAALSTIFAVTLGTPAAYALERHRYPRDVGRYISLAALSTRFIPPFAVAIPVFLMFRDLGVLGSPVTLAIIHAAANIPLVLWIVMIGVRQVPREVEEAATIDGAGPLAIFLQVVLPLLRPVVASAAIIAAIFSWNEFLFALLLTDISSSTLPVFMSQFITDRALLFGSLSMTALIAAVPVVIFATAVQRQLLMGLTAGTGK